MRAPQRKKVWGTRQADVVVTPGTTILTNLGSDFFTVQGLAAMPAGCTVGPFIINLWAGGTTNDASSASHHSLTAGIVVAPSTADADDLRPFTNTYLQWAWWERWSWNQQAATPDGLQIHREIRSMRKFDEIGNSVFLALDAEALAGNIGVDISCRFIVRLP